LTYSLFIERRAQRSLPRIDASDRDRIAGAVRRLVDDPRPHGVKKLSGRNAWRIRVGDHRVLYEIHDKRLFILGVDIGHRGEIYRKAADAAR
jgi:mRNA interferase RelE/StbE